jgi:hypothetical protein
VSQQIRAPGIEVLGLASTVVNGMSRREPAPWLGTHTFRPYMEEVGEYDPSVASPLLQCVSVVIENKRSQKAMGTFELIELTQTPQTDESFNTMDYFVRVFGVPFDVSNCL